MKLIHFTDRSKVLKIRTLFLLVMVFSASEAISQPDSGTAVPPWLQLSFEQRTRFEQLSNPFRTNASGIERYFPLQTRLKLEIGESFRPVRMVVEFQDARVLHNEDRIYSPRSHINEHDFLQAYLHLNTDNFLSRGSKSRILIGRFTMDLGKRRLVARNKMRNTTNAFDVVSWTLSENPNWTIQSFLTRPVAIESYDLDVSSRRYFWGSYFTSKHHARFQADLYYFGLSDMGASDKMQKLHTLGGRLYRLPKTGFADYEMEAAWQFGKNEPLEHRAYFYHGELGFTFNSSWKPRISLHYDYVSGDKNPQDIRSEQFNLCYGARSFEYGPTGIYGPATRSNIDTPGIRVAFSPSEFLNISAMYRSLKLAQAKDAWAGAGLMDQTGSSGKSIGQNFDIRIQWQANRHLTIESGYARLFKGSYSDLVPGSPATGNSNYFFIASELKGRILPF